MRSRHPDTVRPAGARCLALFTVALFLMPTSACSDSSGKKRKKGGSAFPNAVASGDVTETTAVVWARSEVADTLLFEISTSRRLKKVLDSRTAIVSDPTVPAKVTFTGLTPGTEYFYRVKGTSGRPGKGRFVTPASLGTNEGLRFGVSGDWRGDLAPYPSVAAVAGEDLDLFIALGDTIYADVPSPDVPAGQATTLAEFRGKHNEVYSGRLGLNALADLRASTPLLVTIDDHEVTNDFAGGADPATDPRFSGCAAPYINECALYLDALQAFLEYNPIEALAYGATGDPRTAGKARLYRTRRYGSDAAFFLLDARSFRDEELTPVDFFNPLDAFRFLAESFDPSRTMLGAEQLADVKADLLQAQSDGVTWKFVVVPEPIQNLGVIAAEDRFEGYAAERADLLGFIDTNAITNVVFIAADIHGTIINNLTYQTADGQPQIPIDAFEITTGPVAYSEPFGPFVVNFAFNAGIVSQVQLDDYNSRDMAGKDTFVEQNIDLLLFALGYDTTGLAGSGLNVTLLQGAYVAVHNYGWTEFEIDAATQDLTVTVHGIEWYSDTDLANDPKEVLSRESVVLGEFVVTPQ